MSRSRLKYILKCQKISIFPKIKAQFGLILLIFTCETIKILKGKLRIFIKIGDTKNMLKI